MSKISSWIVEYKCHGVPTSFVIRTGEMSNAHAWHWACCDAGIAPLPKPGKSPLKRISKPMAERFGVTAILWRELDPLVWDEV
ncbi:hypothetical protein PGC34_19925 [Pseudomonas kribbensis]|uniref:DUF6555 family protein n=1 Tax=Pseudomonas kribbensis TaxID=1628086 RepID=UPI003BF7A8BE